MIKFAQSGAAVGAALAALPQDKKIKALLTTFAAGITAFKAIEYVKRNDIQLPFNAQKRLTKK